MEHTLVIHLLILLLGTAWLVAACHRLGLSSIVGYLGAGLLFGPHLLGVLQETASIRLLAETGVVLLMFTIGLEFSLPRLLAARKLVFGIGGVQVALVTGLFGLLFVLLGLPVMLAMILAGAFAMSSTAIVLKQLAEQGELDSAHGHIVTAVLLFQDVAAIPFLVLLPLLTNGGTSASGADLAHMLSRAMVVFGLLAFAGRRLLPRFLHWIAEQHSLELFMLSVLALALGAAALSLLAGLSATLGAFMAGMFLGETQFRHQVEADVRPFRDLMLGVFFISVGMQLDPAILLQRGDTIALTLFGLLVVKGMLVWLAVRLFGYPAKLASRVALALAQGGEFGLLLLSQVLAPEVMPAVADGRGAGELLQSLLAGLILSMLLAPLLLRYSSSLVRRWDRAEQGALSPPENLPDFSEGMADHIVLCGYGPLAQGVARVLAEEGVAVLAIDQDAARVRACRERGDNVLYGDAANPALLELARVRNAAALAVSFHDPHKVRAVVAQVRRLNPQLPVVVHTRHGWQGEDALPEQVSLFDSTLEASLMFARKLLLVSGMGREQTDRTVNRVRDHDYLELR